MLVWWEKHSKYIVEKNLKVCIRILLHCYSDDQADWGFFVLHATVWRQAKACRGSAPWSHSEAQPPSALLLYILSSYQFTYLATSDFDLVEDHLVFVYQPSCLQSPSSLFLCRAEAKTDYNHPQVFSSIMWLHFTARKAGKCNYKKNRQW